MFIYARLKIKLFVFVFRKEREEQSRTIKNNQEQSRIIKNNQEQWSKESKTTICVDLCVIYNNIMHLIIILTTIGFTTTYAISAYHP